MQEQPLPSTSTYSSTTTSTTSTPSTSSFNVDIPKNKFPLKMVLGGLALVLLIIGAAAAYYLTQVSTDIRQQAQQAYSCPGGSSLSSSGTTCSCQTPGGSSYTFAVNTASLPSQCAPATGKCPAGWTDVGDGCSRSGWVVTE